MNYWTAAFCLTLALAGCSKGKQQSEPPPQLQTQDGGSLARTHCSSCHAFPEPNLLDKATWKNYVLPRMGYMYGIYPHDSVREALIGKGESGGMVKKANTFPSHQLLPDSIWMKIKNYYLSRAPDNLEIVSHEISIGLKLFEVVEGHPTGFHLLALPVWPLSKMTFILQMLTRKNFISLTESFNYLMLPIRKRGPYGSMNRKRDY